jgi:D-proline reductase (dithiol) PrdB
MKNHAENDTADGAGRGAIRYIERTRAFYAAQGYERPYRWARFDEVPFTRLKKPLRACRAAVITTAGPPQNERAESGVLRGERTVWSGETAALPERLATDHLAWDKENTHTDDLGSFLPIRQLRRCVDDGRLGSLARRFHGAPTDYSQRRTVEEDAPEILRRCLEDEVDIALLVPL